MKWIIQKDFTSECVDERFSKAVNELGSEIQVVEYRPFVSYKDIREGLGEITEPVLFYGCISFISKVQKILDYTPGTFSNFSALCCKSYYPILGDLMFNSDYKIVTWNDLLKRRFNGVRFIRPDSGKKNFLGTITDCETIEANILQSAREIQQNTLVLVTSVKQPKFEWRFFVCNEGKVLTGSQYHANGELSIDPFYDDKAFALAERVCNIPDLNKRIKDLVYVVDVCLTEDNEYKVMELNSFSCAGVYDCDVKKIVEYIELNIAGYCKGNRPVS